MAKRMTNRKKFGCDKCRFMVDGADSRFPYCTHKAVGTFPVHRLVLCPKRK